MKKAKIIEKIETLEEFKNGKQLFLFLDQTINFFDNTLKGITWPNGKKKTAILFLEKTPIQKEKVLKNNKNEKR
ncbi:MAG TPA: hypothetical protein PLJ37_00875 [Chitinophagales bacterium]|nr:hypothetical protein [Chitinophagales bacterium]HMW93505.1 hypothetical protein [Chitinophagales bacterium]HMZ92997.1 hypothetical protein [Chitinophagales bacterium]HNG25939.1 hypothetical protein [Chitinophagales bacterium]